MRFAFDSYFAEGKNCIALLAIASLAAELEHGVQWDMAYFMERARGHSAKYPLVQYIDPKLPSEKRRQIRERNKAEDMVVGFLSLVFNQLRTLSSDQATSGSDTAPSQTQLRSVIAKLPQLTKDHPKVPLPEGTLSLYALLRLDTLNALIDAVCGNLRDIGHPSLPCKAFSEAAIKTRLVGLEPSSPHAEGNSGFFIVVREARGGRDPSLHERNMLVRDAIFLMRFGEEERGYYFSAVDSSSFSLHRDLEPGPDHVSLTGKLESGGHRKGRHPIKLDFRPRRYNFPLQHREVMLVGETLKVNQPAAWKALLIRPEWTDLSEIETHLAAIDDPVEGHNYLAQRGIIGVLFSRIPQDEGSHQHMVARQRSFRELIYSGNQGQTSDDANEARFGLTKTDRQLFEDGMRTFFPELTRCIAEKEGQSAQADEFARLIIDKIEDLVSDNWAYLEPAQIIMREDERVHQQPNNITVEDRERLRHLTDRSHVRPYIDDREDSIDVPARVG